MLELPRPIRRMIVAGILLLALSIAWYNFREACRAIYSWHHAREVAQELRVADAPLPAPEPEVAATLPEIPGLTEGTVAAIYQAAEDYDLDVNLLLGLIKTESNFNPKARNENTNGTVDRGLCQINSNTAPYLWQTVFPDEEYSPEKLFDPAKNVRMGACYLASKLAKYNGDVHRALTAYNRGDAGLQSYISRYGTSRSTYSRKVTDHAAEIGG